MRNLMITGGAGFIGSNYVHYVLEHHPDYRAVVYDKLTYAGNLDNLKDIRENPRFVFVEGDICDAEKVRRTIAEHDVDTIVNFAAETHVDRSLSDAGAFIMTDVYGTHVLLEAVRELGLERYHQVSTDEVYGEVLEGSSVETDAIHTRSPYSASKAGGSAGAGLPRVVRDASHHHPRLEQHRAIPVPGKGGAPLCHQRHGRQTPAHLW